LAAAARPGGAADVTAFGRPEQVVFPQVHLSISVQAYRPRQRLVTEATMGRHSGKDSDDKAGGDGNRPQGGRRGTGGGNSGNTGDGNNPTE
jgi:hypothetical protein